MNCILLILIALFIQIQAKQPYDLITDSLEIKQGSASLGQIVAYAQDGGTKAAKMNVNITLTQNVPNNMIMQIYAKRLANEKYINIGVPIQKNFCVYAKEDSMLYPGFMQSGNFPGRCPIKKGFYYMKDYVVDVDKFPAVLPGGNYKVVLLVTIQGKTIFNIEWAGKVIYN